MAADRQAGRREILKQCAAPVSYTHLPKNREDVEDTRENLIAKGYDPCKRCNP